MLIDTRLGRMFVESHGEGPCVALWPSLFTSGRMWRHQLEPLAEHHRVILIDPPGHARSFVPHVDYTMDDCVAAACELLDHLDEPRVAWGGLSWGGMVGMRLAARHPERVVALALLDTSARPEPAWQRVKYTVLGEGLLRPLGPVREMMATLSTPVFLGATTRRTQPALVEEITDSMSRLDREGMLRGMRAVFSRADATAELARIRAPTLVLVGDEDTATVPAEAAHIAGHVAGARLVRIPAAGHLTTLESPEAVTRELLSWLDTAGW